MIYDYMLFYVMVCLLSVFQIDSNPKHFWTAPQKKEAIFRHYLKLK